MSDKLSFCINGSGLIKLKKKPIKHVKITKKRVVRKPKLVQLVKYYNLEKNIGDLRKATINDLKHELFEYNRKMEGIIKSDRPSMPPKKMNLRMMKLKPLKRFVNSHYTRIEEKKKSYEVFDKYFRAGDSAADVEGFHYLNDIKNFIQDIKNNPGDVHSFTAPMKFLKLLVEAFYKNITYEDTNANLLMAQVGMKRESGIGNLKIYIKFGTRFIPLKNLNEILEKSHTEMVEDIDELTISASEKEIFTASIDVEEFSIRVYPNVLKRRLNQGGFFPYLHNTEINLERYGIYRLFEPKEYMENCLSQALKNAGVNVQDKLYNVFKNGYCAMDKLKDIANIIKLNIIVRHFQGSEVRNKIFKCEDSLKYGTIHLGLLEKHFFLNEPTIYTKYSIVNYFKLKDFHNFQKITSKRGKGFQRDKNREISSFDLIRCLLENKNTHLTPITFEQKLNIPQYVGKKDGDSYELTAESSDFKEIIELTDEEMETVNKKKNIGKVKSLIFFDFESTTDGDGHLPYLLCYEKDDEGVKTFSGRDCGQSFVNALNTLECKKNEYILCIAHNLVYDLSFIIPLLNNYGNIIKKGNRILSLTSRLENCTIKFKDSASLITMRLAAFGRCFQLEEYKDVMPYNLYTSKLIEEGGKYAKIEKALGYLKSEKDKSQFMDNLKNLDLLECDGKKFDYMKYCQYYCEKDVKTLKAGYLKFREWCLSDFDLDINNILTIPSMAMKYMKNRRCLDGCCEVSGVPLDFISKSIVGGRVMCCNNEVIECDKVLMDFDAVSLYPSAFHREEYGFLLGSPKILEKDQLNMGFLSTCDGYFIEIKIEKVNRKLDFPIISYLNDDGIRDFVNLPSKKSVVVNKFTLEDMIKYHEIEFKIIRGYYYDSGRDNRINGLMGELFSLRKKYKSQKNPIEVIYKLIMNASYGKLIQKPISDNFRIIKGEEEFIRFQTRNYNFIREFEQDGELFFVKTFASIAKSFNLAHLGSELLSISKRIMCEVMVLAQDLGIEIMYTDTDSVHIEDDKIELLRGHFMETFDRELIGGDLGQFHSDFCSPIHKDPVSVRSIFLGKKMYVDLLIDRCDIERFHNGEEVKTNYHYRMKGIPNDLLCYDDYEKLLKKETIVFDLCKGGHRFRLLKNLTFKSIHESKRAVKIK